MTALAEQSIPLDPVERVVARLDDPTVSTALHELLDHLDLLAVLVVGLDQMVGRGDTISDSLADGVHELRQVQGQSQLPDLSMVITLIRRLSALVEPLLDVLPSIERLMRSDLADPRVIDLGSMLSRAAVRGAEQAATHRTRVAGVRALMRMLKDEDIARGLGLAVSIAKALGQEARRTDGPGAPARSS
ncbi:MAG: DUF1641 domain-containing protein [Actinomycetes bacterium]